MTNSKVFTTITSKFAVSSQQLYNFLIFILLCLIIFLHSYQLDTIPLGLFFDESTIGIQASNLALTGFETYGGQAPIYFKSDADYDSPILIYTTAAAFKLFGISEYTLRLPNVLFFTIALLLAFWLGIKLFNNNKIVWAYLLVSFGFLPYFFTISRLSFEVISQLASIAGTFLCIWLTFHEENSRLPGYVKPSICGFVIGISTYTYSTASLLSALLMVTLLIIYFKKENFTNFIIIVVTCLIALIPYVIFSITNPGALTSRFQNISFLYEAIPPIEKFRIFLVNYLSNWSLDFLILHGDANLRHSTGLGGTIYTSVFALFILGAFSIVINRKFDKFKVLLLLNLLFTPIASALTSEGNPHAVRTLLMGYFIVLLSCYGLQALLAIPNKLVRNILTVCVFTLLIYEAYKYHFDYFIHYAARSVDAIGSYDFHGAFEFAIEENPTEIILFDNFPGIRDNFLFYSRIVDNPNDIPIRTSSAPIPQANMCIIYQRLSGAEEDLDNYFIPYKQFGSRHRPSSIEKQFGEKVFSGVMKVRCYGKE